jgi:hypothetical protein
LDVAAFISHTLFIAAVFLFKLPFTIINFKMLYRSALEILPSNIMAAMSMKSIR